MSFVALKNLAEIERNGIPPEKIVSGTNYLGLEHIEAGGRIISSDPVDTGDLASTKFRFGPDHLLYGKLRPYLAKIALPDFEGVCSTDILPVRPGPELDKRYLAYFLRQPSMVDFANARSTGANLPRLSPKALGDFQVPWRPLPEQRRIATILDQADALCRLRGEAIARLDELRSALFRDCFDQADQGVDTARLSDVVASGTIVTYGIVQAGDEFVGGVPYIRTGDIKNGTILVDNLRRADPAIAAKFERSMVRSGEIVMSIRATVGTTALVPDALDGANLTQGTARISPGPRVHRSYLLEYLRSSPVQQWIQSQVKGATFREITLARLRELPVRLPPIKAQERFAAMIDALEEQLKVLGASKSNLDTLYTSLQHRAFNGEL